MDIELPLRRAGNKQMIRINVLSKSNFVQLSKVPQIEERIRICDVFQKLAQERAGGLIVLGHQRPQRCIIARELARVVVSRTKGEGWEKVVNETLLDFSRDPRAWPCILPVADQSLEESTALGLEETTAFEMVGQDLVFGVKRSGRQTGWLFTKEIWTQSIYTPAPKWVCERRPPDGPHINMDPDTGRCQRQLGTSICGAPIIGWS
jgi:hypothetical protein